MIRRRAVAFQEQMTAAAVTFEFTAFLDPFPRAVIHLANLGGTLALLADRIAMTAQRMGLPAEMAGRRLRRTVVDTASFGAAGIGLAAATLGADRLLFGTDSPALAIAPQIEGLAAAGLPPAVLADVLAGAALCPAGEIAQS
jgi:aminocarboxymuconate-semialdehyde decarboxylase